MVSCQSNKEDDILSSEFLVFTVNFPELASNISYDNVQKINTENESSFKLERNVKGVTFPVMIDNVVIGRYIGSTVENTAVYIDFTDYKNKIIIYDVYNPSEFESVDMVLEEYSDSYIPVEYIQTRGGFWCKAACTIQAMAIASTDGPSPVMDVLAIAYGIACMLDC